MNPSFVPLDHANDGEKVYIKRKTGMLLVEVAAAMGRTIRVVNKLHGIDTWMHISEVYGRVDPV